MSKQESNGAISLTETLQSVTGEPLTVQKGQNGDEPAPMDVRMAIHLSLTQGSMMLQEQQKLSESEKMDAYLLAKKICDKERTGYTFALEEAALVKKCAFLR